jgi:hypothetical protein
MDIERPKRGAQLGRPQARALNRGGLWPAKNIWNHFRPNVVCFNVTSRDAGLLDLIAKPIFGCHYVTGMECPRDRRNG